MMLCPKCETSMMHERERGDIVMDVCRDCGGVWLDKGELERLLEGAAAAGARRASQHAEAYSPPQRDDRGYPDPYAHAGRPGPYPHDEHDDGYHTAYHATPYKKKHKDKYGKYGYEHKKHKKHGVLKLIEDIFD